MANYQSHSGFQGSGPPSVPSFSSQQTTSQRARRVAAQRRAQRPIVRPAEIPGMGQAFGTNVTFRPQQRGVPGRLAQALAASRAWALPATLGARMGAFIIDCVVVALIGVVSWFGWNSLALTGVVVGEISVVLAFCEARTGATPGNLVMRIRTVRDDAPYSPGVARGCIRSLVLASGFVFAVVGSVIVVVSSVADPMRMGRSWADRAGRTLVVRVPTRVEREAWAQGAEAWAANTLVAPEVSSAPAYYSGVPDTPQRLESSPIVQSVDQLPGGVVTVDAPIAVPLPAEQAVGGEQLLLTLDTGQRVQLPIPCALNLGRRPDPSESADLLWVVHDPDSSVSKTHMRVECHGESVWLTDLGSTNGSAVVDEVGAVSPLIGGARVRYEDGSRVKIGDRIFSIAVLLG